MHLQSYLMSGRMRERRETTVNDRLSANCIHFIASHAGFDLCHNRSYCIDSRICTINRILGSMLFAWFQEIHGTCNIRCITVITNGKIDHQHISGFDFVDVVRVSVGHSSLRIQYQRIFRRIPKCSYNISLCTFLHHHLCYTNLCQTNMNPLKKCIVNICCNTAAFFHNLNFARCLYRS